MGSDAGGLALYEWNMAVSAALFEVLGTAEVIIRNAFHRQLSARHLARGGSGAWYDSPRLDQKGTQDIRVAKDRATSYGRRPELQGKVIAELSFGFWRYLVAKRYQAVIWPALQRAFPHHPDGPRASRLDVEDRIQRIHVVRNRIAHHEPIFRRNLTQDHDDVMTLIRWISLDGHAWADGLTRVPDLISRRPT